MADHIKCLAFLFLVVAMWYVTYHLYWWAFADRWPHEMDAREVEKR